VVTTGEGGAVVTSDRALADRIRALRNHGLDPNNASPDFTMAGLNCRMTDFQGALGRVQLSKLPELLAARRTAASWYADALADVPVERPQSTTPDSHNYQSYVVLLPSALAPYRDSIIQRLRNAGVEATIGTHHIPLTGYYQREFGYRPGDFPVTDDIAARAVSRPMHQALLPEDPPQVALALAASMAQSTR
jgi:perosamine synthetase